MGNVISMKSREHIYELDQCSGCKEDITSDYVEVSLYSEDNQQVKHVALCEECNVIATREGVI